MTKENSIIDLSCLEEVADWTSSEVAEWFQKIGFCEYSTTVTGSTKKINGRKLLQLTFDDLHNSPFFIEEVEHCEQILAAIDQLKEKSHIHNIIQQSKERYFYGKSTLEAGGHSLSVFHSEAGDESMRTPLISGDEKSQNSNSICSELYPVEKLKTFIALAYLLTGFVVSVLTLQFVHERVPSMEEEPPLPDVFFDVVPERFSKAFDVCETLGCIQAVFTILVVVFHRHRYIVLRRIFFIVGTLYLYRSCTMYVTTLPVPGLHFRCAPKAHGQISLMLTRAIGLLLGGGLSITGSHHLCGDYLFSGHTVMIVVCVLSIIEYTPRRWWYVHWISWMVSAVAIICILLAHDHYTIDVVIAYMVTTRLFYTYHTLCNVQVLRDSGNSNMISRYWWFPLFKYFEGNVSCNGPLPRQYEWPLPWPKKFVSGPVCSHRKSPIKGV